MRSWNVARPLMRERYVSLSCILSYELQPEMKRVCGRKHGSPDPLSSNLTIESRDCIVIRDCEILLFFYFFFFFLIYLMRANVNVLWWCIGVYDRVIKKKGEKCQMLRDEVISWKWQLLFSIFWSRRKYHRGISLRLCFRVELIIYFKKL